MSSSARSRGGVLATLQRVAEIVRRIIGVPDYERYLQFMATRHPDTAPLSAREFDIVRLNERYSQPGSRCC